MPPRPRWAPSSPHRLGAATEKPLLMGTRDSTMCLSWWRTPSLPLPGPHRWAGSVKTLKQQRTCTENQSSEKPERPPKTPTQHLEPSGSVCSVTPAGSTPGSAPSLPRPPAAAHLPVPSARQTPHLSSHLWWEPPDGSPKLPRSITPHPTVHPEGWGGSWGPLRGGQGHGQLWSGCPQQRLRLSPSSPPPRQRFWAQTAPRTSLSFNLRAEPRSPS